MNQVLVFLESTGGIYSFRTLRKRFKLKGNKLARLLNRPNITKAKPVEVGCGKYTMNIWKYTSEERHSSY